MPNLCPRKCNNADQTPPRDLVGVAHACPDRKDARIQEAEKLMIHRGWGLRTSSRGEFVQAVCRFTPASHEVIGIL